MIIIIIKIIKIIIIIKMIIIIIIMIKTRAQGPGQSRVGPGSGPPLPRAQGLPPKHPVQVGRDPGRVEPLELRSLGENCETSQIC